MNEQTRVLELEAEVRGYLRMIASATDTILRLRSERDEAYVQRDECAEQVSWTTSRCNDAMGKGFSGSPSSSVAAVCDTLKLYREALDGLGPILDRIASEATLGSSTGLSVALEEARDTLNHALGRI